MRLPHLMTGHVDWPTLARELVVTTLGVLIALALNAWWGERHDRARERAYLRQLTADVDQSLRPGHLPDALTRETAAARATIALLRSFRSPIPPPPDSIAGWLFRAQDFAAYTPLTGNARALLNTRDIDLIRDDRVRAAIVAMVAAVDDYATRTHDYQLKWQAAAADLERQTDYLALTARAFGPTTTDSLAREDATFPLPPRPRREPFPPVDYQSLLRDRDLYRALVKMHTAHKNTVEILQKQLDGLRQIRPVFASPAS